MIAVLKRDQPVANNLRPVPLCVRQLWQPPALLTLRYLDKPPFPPETRTPDKLARVKWRRDLWPRKTRSGQQVGESEYLRRTDGSRWRLGQDASWAAEGRRLLCTSSCQWPPTDLPPNLHNTSVHIQQHKKISNGHTTYGTDGRTDKQAFVSHQRTAGSDSVWLLALCAIQISGSSTPSSQVVTLPSYCCRTTESGGEFFKTDTNHASLV